MKALLNYSALAISDLTSINVVQSFINLCYLAVFATELSLAVKGEESLHFCLDTAARINFPLFNDFYRLLQEISFGSFNPPISN